MRTLFYILAASGMMACTSPPPSAPDMLSGLSMDQRKTCAAEGGCFIYTETRLLQLMEKAWMQSHDKAADTCRKSL